jgi:hypothetical protein
MRRLVAAALACGLAAAPAAARADLFSSVSVGVHSSTIGDGISLDKPILYNFSLRIATGNNSDTQEVSYDGTPYTSTTKNNNIALIGDYRPYAGRYRISAGLVFGNDHIDDTARQDSPSIRVGNNLYPTSGTGIVSTHLTFSRPSLYAGVGTGAGLVRGLALAFDAGVLVRNGTVTTSATGPLANNPAFQADLERLRSEHRTRMVVPVISIGLVYRP